MTITLPHCTVEWQAEHRRVITRFSDGSEAHACPYDDDAYRAHARKSDVGDDVDRYCLDHDIAHAWFGDAICHGPSPVLHAVATGRTLPQEQIDLEEEIVQRMQRYANLYGYWPEPYRTARLILMPPKQER